MGSVSDRTVSASREAPYLVSFTLNCQLCSNSIIVGFFGNGSQRLVSVVEMYGCVAEAKT